MDKTNYIHIRIYRCLKYENKNFDIHLEILQISINLKVIIFNYVGNYKFEFSNYLKYTDMESVTNIKMQIAVQILYSSKK